jgi:hypothetical protein
MALSDLSVLSEYVYTSATEVLSQKIELFNAASANTITLSAGALQGDFADELMWKKMSGLVRRRNPYTNGALTTKVLQQITDTMVKVAAGTAPVDIQPSMFTYIQKSPEEAGVVIGTQLAGDMLADMLNTSILAAYSAMVQNTAMLYNATSDTPSTLTAAALTKAAAKFGDRSSAIQAWVSHSLPMHNMWTTNITNAQNLFTYGSVIVQSDPFGRPFIVTDTSSLIDTVPNPDTYHLLGLVPGAISVEQNNDFTDNIISTNGLENIQRTYQAEWTYNINIKGYAWDKTNGGKAPNDAALATSTNWDKYITSDKDGPGVVLKVNFA